MNRKATALSDLNGYVSAVPTPFRDGRIDELAFSRFCDWQIRQGIAALVVCGTTGEAPTLSPLEQRRVIQLAVEAADGRVPVIAGAGSASTAHAIELARAAEQAQADALLSVVPYYNKPSQEGLYGHFRAIHDATLLPILLYDVPSRCACSLGLETIQRLAELPRIVGLKDATGDLARPALLRRQLGSGFRLFSGDDATALGYLALGGNGCISVTSNVAPRLCIQMHEAKMRGAAAEAEVLAALLSKLTASLFLESNPAPVKYALRRLGHMSDELRLPLCSVTDQTQHAIRSALEHLSLAEPMPHARRRPAAA